jgi:hypothetical protein
MFWDKKKKSDGLPDLPPNPNLIPSIRDFDRPMMPSSYSSPEMNEIHSLPTFPDSPSKKGFSQSAIKDAVSQRQSSKIPPPPSQNFRSIEMEEWQPEESDAPTFPSMPQREVREITPPPIYPSPEAGIRSPPTPSQFLNPNRPIFVKIDKFKSARESLDTVKEKLTEIDELLKMIRDVKHKEDQELVSWEKEMENIKSRISHVSTEIFDNAYSP